MEESKENDSGAPAAGKLCERCGRLLWHPKNPVEDGFIIGCLKDRTCTNLYIESLRRSLAEAEKERDEARDTIKTIAVMLGWGNVPPREVLERSLNANRERIRAAEERAAALEKDLEYERVSQRAAYKKVVAEAEAAEERAAQAERVLRVIFDTTGCVCEDEHREFCPVGIASVALQEAAKGRAPQAPPDSVAGGGAQGEEK